MERKGPVLSEEGALTLARLALKHDPVMVLGDIEVVERDVYAQLTFFRGEWNCSLTFAGAMHRATGHSKALGEAVRQAILRAYDAGEEEGWQERMGWFEPTADEIEADSNLR